MKHERLKDEEPFDEAYESRSRFSTGILIDNEE